VAIVAASHPLARAIFANGGAEGVAERATWVSLVATDLFFSSFAFVPLGLLRIEEQAARFAAFSLLRHAVNIALKVGLLAFGYGVTGALLADILASAMFALALAPELRGRAVWAFERGPLRDALAFGLPKVPHGLLVQTLNLADRRILLAFVSLGEIGVYSVANSFAAAMKFPLSAFEPAWQPFVFSRAGTEAGRSEIAKAATQAAIVFVTCALLLAFVLPAALPLMTSGNAFDSARSLIPPLVLAFLIHGFFLLSSIGIAVAKEARYYPMITGLSAVTNVALNLAFIPRFGVMAAAWSTVAAYAIMAVAGWAVSRRLMDLQIEWRRIFTVFAFALLAFIAAEFPATGASDVVRAGASIVALAIYGAFTWRFALNASDRQQVAAVLRREADPMTGQDPGKQ
jgi:O-antigen/teichoic acid export membrane protein